MGSTGLAKGPFLMCCCLAFLLPLVIARKSCHDRHLIVPHEIFQGTSIGKVNLHKCVHYPDRVTGTNDSNFLVVSSGSKYEIYSHDHVSMPNHPVTLEIQIDDQNGKQRVVPLHLETETAKSRFTRELLRRSKRRWAPMPFSIHENYVGEYPCHVQRVQSDTQQKYNILYSITGQGVDQPPQGLFTMDPKTGDLYVHGPVDREEYSMFELMAYATTDDGYSPEIPLPLKVLVEDDNDNAPVFVEQMFCAEVVEHCKAGTIVGRVNATDRDQPKTLHTMLRYYLLRQIPPTPLLFAVSPEHGIVTTLSPGPDREVVDQYTLIIEVRDMEGRIGCLSSTGTMSITVIDINDQAPSFKQQSYQVEVNENESGMVILRIPVEDKDLINTANWKAVFAITQGNEKGHFNITTDLKTNEGLLYVIKPMNYEEEKKFLLQVALSNEVSLLTQSGIKTSGVKTIPVTVIVKDVDEGPECQPRVKEVNLKENQTIGTVVTEYTAIDPETKSSSGIRYQKLSDPLNWINVADNGRLTTAKVLDYESKDVPTHKYNVTFLATDQSGKTGTCTLMINLIDIDEHQPGLSRNDITICQAGRTTATVQAIDNDGTIDKSAYRFRIDDSKDPRVQTQWNVVQENDHTFRIEDIANNAIGEYTVPILIVDQQGRTTAQNLRVVKCTCPDGLNCAGGRAGGSAALGGIAILIMVLSALLFAALLCFLMACLCGAGAGKDKLGFPDDAAQQNLIVTNTEAPGADVLDPNLIHIMKSGGGTGSAPGGSYQSGQEMHQIDSQNQITSSKMREQFLGAGGGTQTMQTMRGAGGGLVGAGHQRIDSSRYNYSEWQTFMNNHLGDKLYACGQKEEQQHGDDYVLPYNYEGRGSAAGSVGCCSDFRGDDDKMEFLNQLEPKFRTLAEVCAKK